MKYWIYDKVRPKGKRFYQVSSADPRFDFNPKYAFAARYMYRTKAVRYVYWGHTKAAVLAAVNKQTTTEIAQHEVEIEHLRKQIITMEAEC